mmetsp:Transcript_6824/g.10445  ORF Transcript_6824/g.10445 Transcript_6824/m.10445 type:complete len:574 (+) Transcript_6824:93-1814(+)|eukprot:CAMPEP_0167752060 /NCGR_PEP_ID=MMETSP0110_2-20121227/6922_1 /TAXON_ID=629695 /ORGANISM="Gymnochlora sp., Strain CCMP2014" /LENGTH=573 /DNA_ID=CAMNT_0007637621 /DNA_START=248 /DNA_END=1969 /DNA_ORIENTATION=+
MGCSQNRTILAPTVTIEEVATKPFPDQKPGTSGLRKKTQVYLKNENYLENFIQSIFDSQGKELIGKTLILGGDGRYYNKEACAIIIRMAAANGVGKVVISKDFLMSTPCVSALIIDYKAHGGIILTASHNPGGEHEDFGVKYNGKNGGPATTNVTNKIFEISKEIKEYKITKENPIIDTSKTGVQKFGGLEILVIDAVAHYAKRMKAIFNFAMMKKFVSRKDFSMKYDSMCGVAGPFAKNIFGELLGLDIKEVCMNSDPKPDFGGHHPDPNLTYAEELVKVMGIKEESKDAPEFGAAADGDADRNMVLGKNFFVTPSDSLAIIVDKAIDCIPYFKKGLKGVARSMPTSGAVDLVAKEKKYTLNEVPTGWKYFGNLMDDEKLSICGEESFGTGSDHIREKDGIWAVLAWLSILAKENESTKEGELIGVGDIVKAHWKKYGRNYYTRYDYEGCKKEDGAKLFELLRKKIEEKDFKFTNTDYKVADANEFEYKDPVDGSHAKKQGIRMIMEDGSRVIFRLSGTGSVGATVRMYIEQYSKDKIDQESAKALEPLIKLALEWSEMEKITGRSSPTVIT